MPHAKPGLRRSPLLYVALGVLFALAATHRLRDAAYRLDEVVHGNSLTRLPFDADFPDGTLTQLTPEAIDAGLERGERVLTVDGRPTFDLLAWTRRVSGARPGDSVAVSVAAAAPSRTERSVRLTLQPVSEGPPTRYDWIAFGVGTVALPLLCLALGFWVTAVRIRDPLAWLVLLVLLGLAEFVGGHWRSLYGASDWFQPIAIVYQPLFGNLWPISMMLFGIYFPERLPFDRRFPWAKWIVLAPVLFRVLGTSVLTDALIVWNPAAAAGVARTFAPMLPVVGLLHFVAISLFFAASGYRAFRERRPDARRRLMLLHAGAAAALTPLCVIAVLTIAGLVEFAEWMLLPIYCLLFIFPATMAYVIVVERAMDVRLVVRQGIQYLLARGTIRVMQVAASAWIIVAAAESRIGPGLVVPPWLRLLLVAIALAGVFVIGAFAERLRRWVDRRFFREAYDAERILADLANKVRTIVETGPLLETVAHQIAGSLHVPRVAILVNGNGRLEPAYALGYSAVPSIPLHETQLTDERALELRTTLDAEVVLPLSANQKLVGVMGLGPKRSEEPYTSADIRLLDAVATQTGLALENSRLTAEIAAEVAQREKTRREIEIAREVQERLFPQDLPCIRGITYAGACRPALGIGGDYYDFVPLESGQLGIAIGDVSGKGIPAALLMATLRAYLRGQTIGGDSGLATMMSNLNRLVYESSAPNRYATFFYGQYDAASGVMRYVNAGHNPPMLFKAAGPVVRLDVGGPVVGLIPGCGYEEACVTLEPGDILVAFTDGVSEAMNADMSEWGEERLVAVVQAQRRLEPRPLIDTIIAEADRFVADAPQHDDMTLVVLKRTA